MNSGGFWKLEGMTDEALQQGLKSLIASGTKTDAQVVAHLAEVEARRLDLVEGYESLFEYCKEALGLSGNEAFYRIVAARMGRQFPAIFDLLARRELFITTLPLLRDYISQQNHAELLQAVRGKSKREVLEHLATRVPRPNARSHIRKLPPTPRSVAAGPTATLEPLSPVSYRLQLNTSHALKEKLEFARDLMSHANPSGDLAIVVERALDLLITKLQTRRFGLAPEPHFERSKSMGAATPPIATEAKHHPTEAKHHPTEAKHHPTDRRHVPHHVRRQVAARDGLQCSYVSPTGRRCSSRAHLQLHHGLAWAHGGPDTAENLYIFCAKHNALHAEQLFGTTHIHNAISQKRKRSA